MLKSTFFTGHRNYTNLEAGINSLIDFAIFRNINHFYVGMALGTDLTAAKILSDRYLRWTAVIPFPEQTERWNQAEKMLYEQLLPHSLERVTLYPEYQHKAYHVRNQYMIERSELCLAVYDGRQSGGTASVVRKVENLGKDLIIYNPQSGHFTKSIQTLKTSIFE